MCGRHLRIRPRLQLYGTAVPLAILSSLMEKRPTGEPAVCKPPSETAFSAVFNCTQEAARGGSVAVEVRDPRRLSALEVGLASLHSVQAQLHPFIVSGALNVRSNYIIIIIIIIIIIVTMQVYILRYKSRVTRSLFDQLLAELCFESSTGHKDHVRQLFRHVPRESVKSSYTVATSPGQLEPLEPCKTWLRVAVVSSGKWLQLLLSFHANFSIGYG